MKYVVVAEIIDSNNIKDSEKLSNVLEELETDLPHKNYPSRYSIGDIVAFSPSINNPITAFYFPARISGIRFTIDKVLYDLDVYSPTSVDTHNNFTPFYDAIPIRDVDGVMLLDFSVFENANTDKRWDLKRYQLNDTTSCYLTASATKKLTVQQFIKKVFRRVK
jgi:hypothetical protein